MIGKSRRTVVKEFTSRRQMERGIARMSERGYHVERQSGEFSHNPFLLRWNRRRVVVTFERGDEKAPPPALGRD